MPLGGSALPGDAVTKIFVTIKSCGVLEFVRLPKPGGLLDAITLCWPALAIGALGIEYVVFVAPAIGARLPPLGVKNHWYVIGSLPLNAADIQTALPTNAVDGEMTVSAINTGDRKSTRLNSSHRT